jgi:hypothetical protein
MVIPDWLIGLAGLLGVVAFIAFAFYQGEKVQPDRNKDHHSGWPRQTGGGPPPDGF